MGKAESLCSPGEVLVLPWHAAWLGEVMQVRSGFGAAEVDTMVAGAGKENQSVLERLLLSSFVPHRHH